MIQCCWLSFSAKSFGGLLEWIADILNSAIKLPLILDFWILNIYSLGGTLENLELGWGYTRASSTEFWYPILC